MDEDNLVITDWNGGPDYSSWFKFIGPRIREIWNSLPYDVRDRMSDDAVEMDNDEWSRSIDAMGEDA